MSCADLIAIDDVAISGHTVERLRTLLGSPPPYYFFLAEREIISNPDRPILAVDDSIDTSGVPASITVCIAPGRLAEVENNLALANLDFAEFVESADTDGVYRGIWSGARECIGDRKVHRQRAPASRAARAEQYDEFRYAGLPAMVESDWYEIEFATLTVTV